MINYYQNQSRLAAEKVGQYVKLLNLFSTFRLATILIGGLLVYQSFELEKVVLTELIVLLVIVGFAWLVKKQSYYDKRKSFFNALREVSENEIGSMTGYSNIYADGSNYANDEHPYTSDLDIFGKASLFNLINRCATPLGNVKLAQWLSNAAPGDEITKRQEGVRELSTKPDWMQQFKASLLFANGTSESEIKNLFGYFTQQSRFVRPLLRSYISMVPYLFTALAILSYYLPIFSLFLGLVAVINVVLVLRHQVMVNRTDLLLSRMGRTLRNYSEGFEMLEKESWQSGYNNSLMQKLLGGGDKNFSKELKVLSVLIGKLEYRLNIFVGPVLNATMAWDVRQLLAIEDWREENRQLLPKAFDLLASFECMVSLSTIHTNYSSWVFPEICVEEAYTYQAEDLAHPLIPSSVSVSNDFSLDNTYSIDIITGSNMAGKSTFLRTIGINAVLAYAGAPVCASAMKLSVTRLFAYMRIRDSLNESISTFKAELNRIEQLLAVLKTEKKVFFLVDEMLRGTNSVDKYRGSKAVVEKLVSQGAVGIVATHDLQLARLQDKYPHYVRNFYFDIQIVNGEMLFDYKLKEGECKTFNASLLLKRIGIDVDEFEET